MNAKEFNEIIKKIDVDEKTKEGILELIDLKSKMNMEPILNEMKSEFSEIRSEFKIITSELKRIEDKNDTRNTMLMAFMGFLIVLMVALKFIR